MTKPLGYLVMESCLDYEQALVLRTGDGLPPGGILDWAAGTPRQEPRAVFASAAQARAALTRTEHYRLAFGRTGANGLPEKAQCRVVPVVFIDPELQ